MLGDAGDVEEVYTQLKTISGDSTLLYCRNSTVRAKEFLSI